MLHVVADCGGKGEVWCAIPVLTRRGGGAYAVEDEDGKFSEVRPKLIRPP